MPSKEKLRNPSKRPRPKSRYKVTNWTEYNQGLKNRGKLSLYFPAGDLKLQLINENPYTPGVSGQESFYKPAYVELIYITYCLFGWRMRQISGYFEDMWQRQNLKISAPSFGHLSDLFGALPIKTKQFCETVKKRIENGESVATLRAELTDSPADREAKRTALIEKRKTLVRRNSVANLADIRRESGDVYRDLEGKPLHGDRTGKAPRLADIKEEGDASKAMAGEIRELRNAIVI